MRKLTLIIIGSIATALAIAGVLLPGLPTTPFLLVALWAFARSSERLYNYLQRMPIFREALVEARRFEEKRAVRPSVKIVAVATAWTSVAIMALTLGQTRPILLTVTALAAVGATVFMWRIPTDREVGQ